MSLIVATGSNIGDRLSHLNAAKNLLKEKFNLIHESRVYKSEAVDYTNQPDFYNQVLEFELPDMAPKDAIEICLDIEARLGRTREIKRGPRNIDIDIIFWGTESINLKNLIVPHPRWSERSFIVLPLQELPYCKILANHYKIPSQFNNTAQPI